ncbi:G-protein coupled receptor protein [Colletotrichum plurivorum]|uniref:G-protein coupled receptor protein n=1 Tax=Colletotrichum plurivorum TaxID=2175906 RepID=A0A8H6K3W8_9PEZI|nr:G-protein coupled receptor protein [Colletotrichum plurivorum]
MDTNSQPQPHPQPHSPIPAPAWILALRGAQVLLSIIILGLAGAIIHWVYLDELGFAVAVSLFTWIILAYALLTSTIPSLRKGYNTYAVLALDFFLCILWLAAMGSSAAKRAAFVVPVNASCTSDGSAVNSGTCSIYRRGVVVVMGKGALAMFAAVAGLSALEFIAFAVTFGWTLVKFLKGRKGKSGVTGGTAEQGQTQMEAKQPLYSTTTAYPEQGQTQAQYVPQQQHYQQYQEMPGQQQQFTQPQGGYEQQQQHYQQHQQYQQHPQGTGQPYSPSPVSAPNSPPPPQGYTGYPP